MEMGDFRREFNSCLDNCLNNKQVYKSIMLLYNECIIPFSKLKIKDPIEWKNGYFVYHEENNIKIIGVTHHQGAVSLFVLRQAGELEFNMLNFNILSCNIDYQEDEGLTDYFKKISKRIVKELSKEYGSYLHMSNIKNARFRHFINGGDLYEKSNHCYGSIEARSWGAFYDTLFDLHLLKLYPPLNIEEDN